MIRLNVGFNRKVGEPGFGSRGASVNLDVELPSGEVQDVERLRERIRRLFQIARASVAEELEGRPASTPADPATPGRRAAGCDGAATGGQSAASRPPARGNGAPARQISPNRPR